MIMGAHRQGSNLPPPFYGYYTTTADVSVGVGVGVVIVLLKDIQAVASLF